MAEEERRDSMEREISVASSSAAVAGEEANAHVRESAAVVRELVPTDKSAEDDEDVKWRNMDAVADQILFLMEKSTHRRHHRRQDNDDDGNSQNNIPSDNSTAGGGSCSGSGSGSGSGGGSGGGGVGVGVGVAAGAGVVVDAITPPCNGTVSDKKKENSSKKKRSRDSDSGAHTCEECGKAFAKGQSLGGHMRKHYDIQKIIDKRRAREKPKETPAPAVERRVQEPAALTGNTAAAKKVAAAEERTASSRNAPFESRNPALLLQSVQLDEGPSAANGARRPHDFDLNEPAEPEEQPTENAPQPEPERKDDDADDLLSFRLWPKFDSQSSN